MKRVHSRKACLPLRRGFTLVELLIALAVFAVIATFSLGSVVAILNAGRKANSLASVMTNLDSALEVMSREVKFGTHYHCVIASEQGTGPSFPLQPQNCTGNPIPASTEFAFDTSEGVDTIYRLTGTSIQKSIKGNNGPWIAVTAPEVVVQSLKFYVFGSAPQSPGPADNMEPKVIIVIQGYSGTKASVQTNFVVQTMASQRSLDIGP